MDKDLIDGARRLSADELFETVRRFHCETNNTLNQCISKLNAHLDTVLFTGD